jgi:hypothetical protein
VAINYRRKIYIIFLVLFFHFYVSGGILCSPWAKPGSKHPVTLDVLYEQNPGYQFSLSKIFPRVRISGKEVFPFDMLFSFYVEHITNLNGISCRYYPTCSSYASQAIKKYGILQGMVMGAERLMRCHEYQTDDIYDPVIRW